MKKKLIVTTALLVAALLIFWFFYPLRSYIVMGVYSAQHSQNSVMKRHGFSVDMPSGAGWYPFVMTYNADGFAAWSGIAAEMTILYNFGAFDFLTRTSAIYDTDSGKYCAFYGAYALHEDGGIFGFKQDGTLDMDAVAKAVEYDYTQLVLAGFGCRNIVFQAKGFDIQTDVSYAGSGGWTRIDADIVTNGAAHRFERDYTAYLQYGPPTQAVDTDFALTALKGRLYLKYLEDYGCTVMLYVIAPSESEADDCDARILSKTTIAKIQK